MKEEEKVEIIVLKYSDFYFWVILFRLIFFFTIFYIFPRTL
jgi:hypothetical protein